MPESTCLWNSRACLVVTRAQDRSGRKGCERTGGVDRLFNSLGFGLARIGLEADRCRTGFTRRCSRQDLWSSCRRPGMCGMCSGDAVKSDRTDAGGIAQPIRLGWFRPVHRKSPVAQEVRAFPPRASRSIEAVRHRDEPVRHSVWRWSESRADHAEPLCRADQGACQRRCHVRSRGRGVARRACSTAARVRKLRKKGTDDGKCRCAGAPVDVGPGVGAIVALTYVSAIDDPTRFESSKGVGVHFGPTPKKHQSARRISPARSEAR